MGSGGIAPRILKLVTRWRWVVSFILRSFYPWGKNIRYPFYRRMGRPQSRSGYSDKKEIHQVAICIWLKMSVWMVPCLNTILIGV